ncbi:hypothetical protein AGLY_013601 [Aphis glycines]|uniref:Uncharacterized protein n=1 Tax=Aphis glycines TaxID=307491 RepID=A0A6G0T7M8_APHGL|nr:hypothetical protein AGLY_013601 [Aphis glycines]
MFSNNSFHVPKIIHDCTPLAMENREECYNRVQYWYEVLLSRIVYILYKYEQKANCYPLKGRGKYYAIKRLQTLFLLIKTQVICPLTIEALHTTVTDFFYYLKYISSDTDLKTQIFLILLRFSKIKLGYLSNKSNRVYIFRIFRVSIIIVQKSNILQSRTNDWYAAGRTAELHYSRILHRHSVL